MSRVAIAGRSRWRSTVVSVARGAAGRGARSSSSRSTRGPAPPPRCSSPPAPPSTVTAGRRPAASSATWPGAPARRPGAARSRRSAARQRHPRICAEGYGRAADRPIYRDRRRAARSTYTVDPGATGAAPRTGRRLRPILGDPERRRPDPGPTRSARPRRRPHHRSSTRCSGVTRSTEIARALPHHRRRRSPNMNQLTDPDHLAEGQTPHHPTGVLPRPAGRDLLDDSAARPASSSTLQRRASRVEPVTFEITAPDGSTYTGSPHVTGADGEVTHHVQQPSIALGHRTRSCASGDGGTARPTPRSTSTPATDVWNTAGRPRRFSRRGTQRHQRRRPARTRTASRSSPATGASPSPSSTPTPTASPTRSPTPASAPATGWR